MRDCNMALYDPKNIMVISYIIFKSEQILSTVAMKANAVERTQSLNFKLHVYTLFLVILGQKLSDLSSPQISPVEIETYLLEL